MNTYISRRRRPVFWVSIIIIVIASALYTGPHTHARARATMGARDDLHDYLEHVVSVLFSVVLGAVSAVARICIFFGLLALGSCVLIYAVKIAWEAMVVALAMICGVALLVAGPVGAQ